MKNPFSAIRKAFEQLPEKKKYIEVITASLSIPVLLSVVLVNYFNIQERRASENLTPTVTQAPQDKTPTIITIIKDAESTQKPVKTTVSPTPTVKNAECIKDIGPVSILTPEQNTTVSGNPLEINIIYDQGDYCSVVWRYRINGTNWSNFSDSDIDIYNMDSGKKTLELEVKSIVTGKSMTLTRNFTYSSPTENGTSLTPTLSPTPTE